MPPTEFLPIPEPMPANPPPPPPERLPLPEPIPEDAPPEPGKNGRRANLVKLVVAPILLVGTIAIGSFIATASPDTSVATPTNTTAATATVPSGGRSLDGTYAITSTVTESTVGRGVSCTNDPVEWVVTTALVGATRNATVVSSNGSRFTLGLQADDAFNVAEPVAGSGVTGTSILFGRFDSVANPPKVSGESILKYTDSSGLERTCRFAFTGARIR